MQPTLSAATAAFLLGCQPGTKDSYDPDECQDGGYIHQLLTDTLIGQNHDELCNAFDDDTHCLVPAEAFNEAKADLDAFSDEGCVTAHTHHPDHARYQVFAIDLAGGNASLYLEAHPDLISVEGFDANGQISYQFATELVDSSHIQVNGEKAPCGSCVTEERNFDDWLLGIQESYWEIERSTHHLDGYTEVQF